ncbi:hypothetical protein [Parapedobacter soli]|uniref:hypothetical protein n=1 Tax=Parapedobacter soli TaxID=416955 RepID=UPI0021C7F1A8|nr:hypothetical protein [Parapedobacter soli]
MKSVIRTKAQKKGKKKRKNPVANEFDDALGNPLRQADIVVAIQYYGITELLDHIGVAEVKRYLANNQQGDNDQISSFSLA